MLKSTVIGVGLTLVFLVVAVVWILQAHKAEADRAARIAADWAADYHNPDSPNYDATRVAAELAAWANDPHNPASPNYDPNAPWS